MELQRIEPVEAKRRLDSGDGHVYLDVRTAEEFRSGHAPGAINIPVMVAHPRGPGMMPNPAFLQQVRERFAKDAKLITACLRGGRSMQAARMLLADGYANVADMRGGYDGEIDAAGRLCFPGWARLGFPTTMGE
jgi:rhodanese-related sulfurtransferase